MKLWVTENSVFGGAGDGLTNRSPLQVLTRSHTWSDTQLYNISTFIRQFLYYRLCCVELVKTWILIELNIEHYFFSTVLAWLDDYVSFTGKYFLGKYFIFEGRVIVVCKYAIQGFRHTQLLLRVLLFVYVVGDHITQCTCLGFLITGVSYNLTSLIACYRDIVCRAILIRSGFWIWAPKCLDICQLL